MLKKISAVLVFLILVACDHGDTPIDLNPSCLNTFANDLFENTDTKKDAKISSYRALDGSIQYWVTNSNGGSILNENCEEICTFASLGIVGFALCPEGTTQAEFIEVLWGP